MVENRLADFRTLYRKKRMLRHRLRKRKVRSKFAYLYCLRVLLHKSEGMVSNSSVFFQRKVRWKCSAWILLLVLVRDALILLLAEKLKFRELFRYFVAEVKITPFFLVKVGLERRPLLKDWQLVLHSQMSPLFSWCVPANDLYSCSSYT